MPRFIKTLMLTLVLTVGLVQAALAMDLNTAKAQGLVGERPDGYLGIVRQAGGVAALVNDINNRRRTEYQALARRNGTSLRAVEQVVGQKLVSRAGRGEYVMTPSGQWVRK